MKMFSSVCTHAPAPLPWSGWQGWGHSDSYLPLRFPAVGNQLSWVGWPAVSGAFPNTFEEVLHTEASRDSQIRLRTAGHHGGSGRAMSRPLPARASAALDSGQAGKEQGRGREACAASGPAFPPAQRAPGLPDLGWVLDSGPATEGNCPRWCQ